MGAGGGPKTRVRVAFTGEEYGFGYQALGLFLDRANTGGISDGGSDAVRAQRPQELVEPTYRNRAHRQFEFKWDTAQRQPLRTKEQALMAVKQHTADYALIPFYSPYTGYDFEGLRAIASQFTLFGCEQVEAVDNLCLAVYEPQVLEIVQAAHPGSALSGLLKHDRRGWGSQIAKDGEFRNPQIHLAGPDENRNLRAGLMIDHSQQLLLRDRIDTVFTSADASRRCKSKLDGLRSAGVDVKETLNTVEPHREMARLARQSLNTNRQTTSFFDPRTGQTSFASTMNAEAMHQKLYAVILPFQVAMMSPEYVIIDPYMEDSDQPKTRFMAVEYNLDETLFNEELLTTDAKTRYWMKRLRYISAEAEKRYKEVHGKGQHHDPDPRNHPGVRVMLAFQRAGAAAATADVENYLRNFGVSYSVARLDEDSESHAPANILLDIEFKHEHFHWKLGERLRGSIVNGAMKKAFQRWKARGVLVLAAMPYERAQLPPHRRRHWLFDTPGQWLNDFVYTMFVRASRPPYVFAIMGAIIALAIYLYTKLPIPAP